MTKGHRIVLLCAVTQNIGFGTLFGTFGPLLPSTVEQFGISLMSATLAMSMATLAIGGSAPLVGVIVQKLSAGKAMTVAAGLSTLAYAIIGLSPFFPLVLACYAVLGVCTITLGIIGPLTLVSQHFSEGRGRMLGFVHMPIFLMIAPVMVAGLLPHLGRSGVLMMIAGLFLLLTLVLRLEVGSDAITPIEPATPAAEPGRNAARLVHGDRALPLLLLSIAVGIISASSVVFMAHIVPFGLDRGMALGSASLLISLFSALGIAGSPVAGWLSDRIGPYRTLGGAALAIALLWLTLPSLPVAGVFLAASLLGFFAAPINTLHAAAVGALYRPDEVGRAIGLSYLAKLPMIFGMAPFVAFLADRYGGYVFAFGVLAAITLISVVLSRVSMAVARRRLAQAASG